LFVFLFAGLQNAAALPLVFCTHEDGSSVIEWSHDVGSHVEGTESAADELAAVDDAGCDDVALATTQSVTKTRSVFETPPALDSAKPFLASVWTFEPSPRVEGRKALKAGSPNFRPINAIKTDRLLI
jgi:hypothetical protein